MSTSGIRGPDSQGIATSTQSTLTHTENIHTPATTRVVESREPLYQSQLIATLTPSELGSSAKALSKQTVSLTHTQQLYTSVEVLTGYDQSTSISSTPMQLSTPSTNPTGWNSKLPISLLMIEMSAAVVVVVFVGILVIVTIIIAVCCR